jgi:TonB family protein
VTACQTGQRSYSESTSSTGAESPGVQPAGDPRFPTSYATNRQGYWVDIPRRTGSVSPTGVARAVAAQIDEFSDCCPFCEGRRGQFSLQFQINPNGTVQSVQIIESPTSDDEARQCIRQAASGGTFPSADRPYDVVVPLHFDLRERPDAG